MLQKIPPPCADKIQQSTSVPCNICNSRLAHHASPHTTTKQRLPTVIVSIPRSIYPTYTAVSSAAQQVVALLLCAVPYLLVKATRRERERESANINTISYLKHLLYDIEEYHTFEHQPLHDCFRKDLYGRVVPTFNHPFTQHRLSFWLRGVPMSCTVPVMYRTW